MPSNGSVGSVNPTKKVDQRRVTLSNLPVPVTRDGSQEQPKIIVMIAVSPDSQRYNRTDLTSTYVLWFSLQAFQNVLNSDQLSSRELTQQLEGKGFAICQLGY